MKKVFYSTVIAVVASAFSAGVALANPSPTGCVHGQGLTNAGAHNGRSNWCVVTPPPDPV